ncbi:UNVERIFIED_CONTAM: hypothetical protein Sradi_5248300 [Sesamum radiatum]|uniref:Uncharacterized protein n=1 Tax=Sesamum radiatum TaxID=300843 RepID=A0AAW2LNK4_SESRA
MGHGLKMRSYSDEAHRTAMMKAWTNDASSERWDMRRGLRAHAERRNAEAERECSWPSRDASAGSEIVAETHSAD